MVAITELLMSPYWWLSVVLVGILVNLVSAYLKLPLDNAFSRISIWLSDRIEKKRSERQARVDQLEEDSHEQLMVAIDHVRKCIFAGLWALAGLLIFFFNKQLIFEKAQPLLLLFGFLFLCFGLKCGLSASVDRRLLSDARKLNGAGLLSRVRGGGRDR